jgi:mannose-1-phosphate guanylyltransferase
VVTGSAHAREVAKELPRLPKENLLIEPVGRNTAAGIGYAAIHAHRRNPKAVLAILPADHFIRDEPKFRGVLTAGLAWAWETGDIVTLGITPDRPETGYGYLRKGEQRGKAGNQPVHRVAAFVEKPDLRKAKRYLASGDYAWNSGIFVLSARRMLEETAYRLPALSRGLAKIEKSLGKKSAAKTLKETFPKLPSISIDYGIMEAAAKEGTVVSLPCRAGWSDVGDFTALAAMLVQKPGRDAVVGTHVGVDSSNLIVYAPEKLVATVGVKDIIIVNVEDTTLICSKKQAQDIRKVVELLKQKKLGRYL